MKHRTKNKDLKNNKNQMKENRMDDDRNEEENELNSNKTDVNKIDENNLNKLNIIEEKLRVLSTNLDLGSKWVVCHIKQLPDWMQDNEYLHLGHRPPLVSFKECFKSTFRLHTETINIWTHMLPFLISIPFSIYTCFFSELALNSTFKFAFFIYFLSAISCFGFSFLFHMFACYYNKRIVKIFSRLDYLGIAILISGSVLSCIYLMYFCNQLIKYIYTSIISIMFILTSFILLNEKFSQPEYRAPRAYLFIIYGCTGIIPSLHWIFFINLPIQSTLFLLKNLFLMGFFYITGGLLYAARIPERFWPGKCDYLFHSHQIFHILVIIAALFHFQGLKDISNYILDEKCDIL